MGGFFFCCLAFQLGLLLFFFLLVWVACCLGGGFFFLFSFVDLLLGLIYIRRCTSLHLFASTLIYPIFFTYKKTKKGKETQRKEKRIF